MSADLISKATGTVVHVSSDEIVLSSPQIVRLDIDRGQIASIERQGNDLLVHLASGETIHVANFYAPNAVGSDLVLRDGEHHLWLADTSTTGAARFTAIDNITALEDASAAAGGGGGSGALLPAILGVAGAGGLVAALAGGGGGSTQRSSSGGSPTPDTTPPAQPTAAFSPDGTTVSGQGEAGATVTIRDAAGNVLGTGAVGGNGNYAVTLAQPQTNGQTVSVTEADSAGNTSSPTMAIAPDLVAPAAPTAQINADGTVVSGTGEAGDTVQVRDAAGTVIGAATVDAQGNYAMTLNGAHANGSVLAVSQSDPAGNTSPGTSVQTPDLVAPAAPQATIAADGTVVTGQGEPGATVTVAAPDGTPLATATVAADGSFTAPLTTPQANGETLDVRQTDPAGNVSPDAVLTAPDITAPTGLTATISADGAIVSGTGEPGAVVDVRDGAGGVIGSATVAADGGYAVALTPAQANGQPLVVTQTDSAGNPSAPVAVTAPDQTAPAAPLGVVAGDGLSVSGTGEPNATLTIRDASGATVGTAVIAADGSYTAVLTTPETNGQQLQLTQADAAGNVSPATSIVAPDIAAPTGLTATVDATGAMVIGVGEPGATVIVRDPAGVQIGTATIGSNGAYTAALTVVEGNGQVLQVTQSDAAGNTSAPVAAVAPDFTAPAAPAAAVAADGASVTGTGEPGATVSVTDAAGTTIGSALVAADGTFTALLTTPETNGEALTVRQTDAAGNPSPAIAIAAPDLTAPPAPVATINADGTVLNGTGEAGATVVVRDAGGAIIGTSVVTAAGDYAVLLSPPLANGQTVAVTQADAAGNLSAPASAQAPDITAPATPTLAISANGAVASGTGEAGAHVSVTGPAGIVIGTATVAGDGTWSAILSTPQANGETVHATATDPAGNLSGQATTIAPDITAPPAPAASLDATGSVVSGTGEPGATITVRGVGNTVIGTGTVDAQGHYSVVLTTPQIDSQVLGVTQTDIAANPSATTPLTAPDLTAPPPPTGTVAADGASITGSGEAGATVVITDPVGTPIGSVVVASDGTFTTALVPPQINGQILGLVETDAAGNASLPGSTTAPDLVLNDSPAAPTAVVAADGATVSGTGDAGNTITVTAAGGVIIGTALGNPGGTYTVVLTTPEVNGETLRVTQTDAEGDVSPPAVAIAPDLTPPAAPTAAIDAAGLVVSGTGEAGATVRVTDPAGAVIGTATVAANGAYAVALTTPEVNGQALGVTQVDAAGNISPSAPVIAPDTTAPAAPTLVIAADGASASGIGEPGAFVTISGPGGATLGLAIVAGDGTWTTTLATPQLNGERLTAIETDAAGNVSPAVAAIAPDLTAPAAPTAAVDASGLIVTGTGEAGATVTVRDAAGTVLGTALVGATGTYSAALSTAELNGQQLHVTQADLAGNVSPEALATAPDITPPAPPSAVISADGTTASGQGEAGATVTVTDPVGAVIGTAIVASDGTWSTTLTAPQANGQILHASETDTAGNVSPTIAVAAPDITPPAAPTGVVVTNDGTMVTGQGEVGATAEVRDANGTLLGSALVAANGSFVVTLAAPQTAGQPLDVSQHDASGNQSPAVDVVAPYDIVAFDNAATASVDLVPTMTAEDLGTANYLALVSLGLLNLDVQVLGIPNVQFTVQPGHTLDADFTYNAVLGIGVLSGYSVVVQKFDGTNWVAVTGTGNSTLLQLNLLNGDLVAHQTLDAGQYRAFVTFDGALGVGLLGGLNVSGTDNDYLHPAATQTLPASGNVITDPGPTGQIDVASPQTEVTSVTINGVTTAVTTAGTTVAGAWGTLTIDPDGHYTYTPADAAAIGHTDSFTYTLIDHQDGEIESATLAIAIASPDVTGVPVAASDSAVATAHFDNVVTTIPAAVDSSFTTPTALLLNGPQTGTVHDSFTVGPNAVADVTLSAILQGGLSVLPTYTITVTNAAGAVVGTVTQAALLNLGLGTGVSLVLHGLPSGTYNYTVSSTNVLGTGYGTSVYVGESVTHLDQHVLTGSTAVDGNILANDATASDFSTIRVQSGASFVTLGETPTTIQGAHGTLTIDASGDYHYQPAATLAYAGTDPVDSFVYQIVSPTGQVATAHLDVAIDINNGQTPPTASVTAVDGPMGHAVTDVVTLVAGPLETTAAHPSADPFDKAANLALALNGPDDGLATLIDHFLGSQKAVAADALSGTEHAAVSAAPILLPDDPLAYLAPMPDDQHQHLAQLHLV